MKNFVVIALVFCASMGSAQKYFSKTGKITFHSEAALEKIDATNSSASTVIDMSTGSMEWAVLIQGFQFEKALMQEHFNENYMESSIYPKAKFKGKIENVSSVNIGKDGTYPVNITGQLEMHGVTKTITVPATFTVRNGSITAKSTFKLLLEDYNIQIPKLIEDNVSKEVQVEIFADYKPMNATT
jgi:polyisoprenoid-binding protein YceI